MNHTRDKLLDAAEKLIAEQGYAGTSLRQIIAEAGVNLASIHYHFGSKDELMHEVVRRKVSPVNDKRLKLFDALKEKAGGKPVPVQKLLEAFLLPMGEVASSHPQFVRVMGRLVAEGLLPSVIERNFKPIQVPFTNALREALPHLSEEEFGWRIQFMIGVIAHTMCASSEKGFAARIEWLVAFLTGGFSAPPAKTGDRR